MRYAVRIDGHLDDHWSALFGSLDLARHDDGTTTLAGLITDQTHLHGLLAQLRDIGAPIVELRTIRSCTPTLTKLLYTDRLILRPATAADAEATWRFRRLESVNRWLTVGSVGRAEYHRLFTEPDRLATTVILELRSGSIVGDFMVRVENAWAQREVADQARATQAELGWVLDPDHAGHGYASEAARALLRYCFDDLGVRRVVANSFLDNDASWRLMERIGMRREGHAVRESLHRSGRWLDTVGYAVLAEEWRR